jgi:hypothetical protein
MPFQRLSFASTSAHASIEKAAIGVGIGLRGIVVHSGIFYQLDDEPLQFLHLAWHRNLQNQDAAQVPEYGWVLPPPRINQRKARQIANACKLVWERNGQKRIPYGFRIADASFSENGDFLLGDTSHGLTCSTFVILVHDFAGVPLLQKSEWRTSRLGDEEVIQAIAREMDRTALGLLASGRSEEAADCITQASRIRAYPRCARFRGEEVAGAYVAEGRPPGLASCERAGREIVEDLQAIQAIGQAISAFGSWLASLARAQCVSSSIGG